MARIISFFTTVFLALQSLFGIGGMAFGKVTIVPEAEAYPLDAQTVSTTLCNGTFQSISYNTYYNLEKQDGSEWVLVEPKVPMAFPDVMLVLGSFRSQRYWYDLSYYDALELGRYRIAAGYGEFEFTLVSRGGVTLTPEFDTYPVGTKEVKATLYNGSPYVFEYTTGYGVQKWDGGDWVWVNLNLDFTMDMNRLMPLQSRTFTCNLSYCDPPLDAGRYRIAVSDAYGEFTLE